MTQPPTAVLRDIGNVIVRWEPRTLYSKIFPDPVDRDDFLARVCAPTWHHQADLGRPMADGVAILIAEFPEHAAAIAAWSERWWEMFSGPIVQTTAAMRRLDARGVPQFALSNMPAEVRAGVFAMDPAFGLLRDSVISGDERLTKPDPAIFTLACRRAGLPAEALLFVDDSPVNIEGARALGSRLPVRRPGRPGPRARTPRPALSARGLAAARRPARVPLESHSRLQ